MFFVFPVPESVKMPVVRFSVAMISEPTLALYVSETLIVYVVLSPLTVTVIMRSPAVVVSNPDVSVLLTYSVFPSSYVIVQSTPAKVSPT